MRFLWIILAGFSWVTAQEGPVLVWAEEFNGAQLDMAVWNVVEGDGCPDLCGWGNNELQRYSRENYALKDGVLVISAREDASGFTSARLNTRDKMEFQYGTLEVRAKFSGGKGLWPAAWLLGANIDQVGWPRCGEIDLLEYVGREPGKVFHSLHTQASHGNTVNTRKIEVAQLEDTFHTYKMEWDPSGIRFYVDDVLNYTYAPQARDEEHWPFDQPFYLLLNMAIGGNFGGAEIDHSAFPSEYMIDYIRLWK